ncbi:MAG: ROK family protein [Dehalococcoidia bacterium]
MEDYFVIAVDIGGTNYRVALADCQGKLVNRRAEPTRSWESPEIGLKRIIETIRETGACVDFGQVKGIAVSAAGPLDPERGVMLTPPSLPAWRNVPVKAKIEEAFHLPVLFETDTDMAALGEQRFGAARGCSRVIYLTVSTGIGGGIIFDNIILRGANLSVAEIGHMVVDPNGPQCNCGGQGHLEPLASGTAIARNAAERISAGQISSLSVMCNNDLDRITAEMVVKAASNGDSMASNILEEAGMYLGMAITSLIHLLDPEVVIIGGGVANAGDLILNPIRAAIEERIMPDFRGRARVVRSELGDDSGIMGAIALALDEMGNLPR